MPTAAPWILRAWAPVLWQAHCTAQLHFVHLDTRVVRAESRGTAGQTFWIGPHDDGEAGMAWDWVQLDGGVVAMADPMAVITNLRLLDEDGHVLTAWQSARYLNALVHGLPWQEEVCRALDDVKLTA
jgi:hypothetical protein